jgi:hypothetical protein
MLWPVSPPSHNEHGRETGSSYMEVLEMKKPFAVKGFFVG